jgi:ribosomal protein S8
LKKQILICNEVGEATFISHAILSRRTFFQSTKDDLLGMGLERIVYGPTWGEQLTASLFREGEEPQKKVNVRDREEMRKLITASITSQKWLGLNSNERVALCFSGKRLSAIGNLFGINGRPVYVSSKEIPTILNGLGLAVISTSKGLVSNIQAKKEHIGGELMFEIW